MELDFSRLLGELQNLLIYNMEIIFNLTEVIHFSLTSESFMYL